MMILQKMSSQLNLEFHIWSSEKFTKIMCAGKKCQNVTLNYHPGNFIDVFVKKVLTKRYLDFTTLQVLYLVNKL